MIQVSIDKAHGYRFWLLNEEGLNDPDLKETDIAVVDKRFVLHCGLKFQIKFFRKERSQKNDVGCYTEIRASIDT